MKSQVLMHRKDVRWQALRCLLMALLVLAPGSVFSQPVSEEQNLLRDGIRSLA